VPVQLQVHFRTPHSRNRAFDTQTIPYVRQTHVIIVMSAHTAERCPPSSEVLSALHSVRIVDFGPGPPTPRPPSRQRRHISRQHCPRLWSAGRRLADRAEGPDGPSRLRSMLHCSSNGPPIPAAPPYLPTQRDKRPLGLHTRLKSCSVVHPVTDDDLCSGQHPPR
jgi:hypothetical protein